MTTDKRETIIKKINLLKEKTAAERVNITTGLSGGRTTNQLRLKP